MNLLTTLDTHSSTTIPCQIKLPACMLQCVLVSMRDAWSFKFMWKLESQSGKGESGELSRSIWSKETWRFCSYKRLISPHVLENQKSSWKLKFVLSHTHTHISTQKPWPSQYKSSADQANPRNTSSASKKTGKMQSRWAITPEQNQTCYLTTSSPQRNSYLQICLPNHLQPTKQQLPAYPQILLLVLQTSCVCIFRFFTRVFFFFFCGRCTSNQS